VVDGILEGCGIAVVICRCDENEPVGVADAFGPAAGLGGDLPIRGQDGGIEERERKIA
jgi:hypothetical protein